MWDIGRLHTVSFFGTCGAGARLTLVSRRLPFPFITHDLSAHFALNAAGLLQLRFFLSPDDSAPTTELPRGTDLLAVFGQVGYFAGDDDRITAVMQWYTAEAGLYLKVAAMNNDVFDHTVNAYVTIQVP